MKISPIPTLALVLAFASTASASENLVSGINKCSSIEVRKEWRSLSKKEKKAWISAVNCLSRVPRSGKLKPPVDTSKYTLFEQIAPVSTKATYYDEFVYAHMNLNPLIHLTGLFLPWHRQATIPFQTVWTNALRNKCGYKGVAPYWAWEYDAADFEHSSIWDTDPVTGLGGFGDPNDDYILKTGGFNLSFVYPIEHQLRRKYEIYPLEGIVPGYPHIQANTTFTRQEVRKLLAQPKGNFTAFQNYMERPVGMHASVHGMTGGDLAGRCPRAASNTSNCPLEGASTFSANEPLFYLHHGNIDRLWWLWQEKNAANKFAFHGGSVQNISTINQYPNGMPPYLKKSDMIPTAGMYKSISINDVLDTRTPPFCYVYE